MHILVQDFLNCPQSITLLNAFEYIGCKKSWKQSRIDSNNMIEGFTCPIIFVVVSVSV